MVANREFHSVINADAGNPFALSIVENHSLLLAGFLIRDGQDEQRFQHVIDEYKN